MRSVSAQGTFMPDRVRVVSATQSGVIDQLFVKPGSVVSPGRVVAQMDESGARRGRDATRRRSSRWHERISRARSSRRGPNG